MEEELRWGPLGSINSRRPRIERYGLPTRSHSHESRPLQKVDFSIFLLGRAVSQPTFGLLSRLRHAAFQKRFQAGKLSFPDAALCRLLTPVHPHNHRFFGGLWRRTLLLEYHVVEDEPESCIFSSHVRETEYTQSCCLKVTQDHVHRSNEG